MAKRKKNKMARTVSACGGPMDGVLAKALAHPLRAEILAYLNDHGIASPAEMNRAGLGRKGKSGHPDKDKLSNVAYHVRVLHEMKLIKRVRSRRVRGSVEHFYEPRARMLLDVDEWSKLPKGAKSDVSIRAVEETLARAGKAIAAGTFDSFDERAVINLPLRLDGEGFVFLAEEITDFMRRCEQVQNDAIVRVGGELDQLMHASASLLLYESPPPERAESNDGKEAGDKGK